MEGWGDRDEAEQTGMMPVMRDILLQLHKEVFAAVDAPGHAFPCGGLAPRWDVRHVLQEMRKKVPSDHALLPCLQMQRLVVLFICWLCHTGRLDAAKSASQSAVLNPFLCPHRCWRASQYYSVA